MILHICSRAEWAAAQTTGSHTPAGYATDGFVHCSDPGTVHLPANRLFRGRDDLLLLVIEESRLDAELVWEPAAEAPDPTAATWFPHVYGPIPVTAVTRVVEFPEGEHGFTPPAGLHRWPLSSC
ncbi:uncharacterized protein (DUF952 family) [Crossiella equi]|uniref:Uncharacterized protein (DUF952 family) n=1 Tax=Crossiella equi TaxID=130796 RepID=A0ABS5A8W1_9PSEU|nr:DUF952 domain-containing protein [Crossiella equi]MBP2473018.1 uncharacterized protein (DUF952 family) [Crossiella equi]